MWLSPSATLLIEWLKRIKRLPTLRGNVWSVKVSLREIIFLVAGVLIGGGLLYIWEAPFFPQPVYPKDTFIVGKVTLAPICPVETMPSDPNCLPQPYKTTVQVTNSKAFQLFDATVETNDQGEFKVAIDDPYTYDVRVVG